MNMKNTPVLTGIVEALIEHADWFFPEGIVVFIVSSIRCLYSPSFINSLSFLKMLILHRPGVPNRRRFAPTVVHLTKKNLLKAMHHLENK